MQDNSGKWIFGGKRKKNCRQRIFCLPYAGSGASLYSVWDSFFDDDIEICPVQLSGRENRRREPLCSDIQDVAGSIAGVIADMADVPFSVFGYSMGGVIAYETVLKLKAEHNIVPQYLFMGASSVFSDRTEKISELDDEALISYLRSIGNSSEDVFGDEQYRAAFLPVIRNDYRLIENAHFSFTRVDCPIVSFACEKDKAMPYRIIQLLKFMTDNWTVYDMTGDHFFIHRQLGYITDIIKATISSGGK